MAKAPKKPPPDEDEAESRRFIEEAERLISDGDLNPTGAEEAFERLMGKALPARSLEKPQPKR